MLAIMKMMYKIYKEIKRVPKNIIKNYKNLVRLINFRLKNPGVKVIKIKRLEFILNGHYSQCGQDAYVYKTFFKNKTDGYFCDVGGNHPININNTYMFENLGWDGCCFEPVPVMEKLWSEHRRAKFFSYAATEKEEELKFTVVSSEALSYVNDTFQHEHVIGNQAKEEIVVQGRPIKDVLAENNIKHIDYMSMDIEGHELQALKGIDFDAVRINVLTVENHFGDNWNYGDDEIQCLLRQNGFKLHSRILGLDDIYVHKDYKY